MYRNNILLTFSDFNDKSEIGIYKMKKSREVIPVEAIDFISLETKQIARNLLNWIIVNNINSIYNYRKNAGIFNHLAIRHNNENEYLVEIYMHKFDITVINRLKFWNWANFNVKSVYYQIEDKNKNNFRDEYKLLCGDLYLYYKILDYKIAIKAGCFFQTNNSILLEMYSDIVNFFKKDKSYNLLDLYCGVGIISIVMSSYYNKCVGIEINQNAIDLAKYNMTNNNISNCDFLCDRVEDIINDTTLDKIIIFVNPPRSGLYENVINKINSLKQNVIQILYLSCCKKTLERDLQLFDYNHQMIKEYDMFPGTEHKEYLVYLY
jgi:23S rRNA (uracil1939-C5)-methyltransferase